MTDRAYNFNPGPAALPLEALQRAQKELLSYNNTGISILETSHRSPEFSAVMEQLDAQFRKLFAIPDSFAVLFVQGGANLQFSMVPQNLLPEGAAADYIDTGSWSVKAIAEAERVGNVNVAASGKEKSYTAIPPQDALKLTPDAAYVHLTSNNTIAGTQWSGFPQTGDVPLVADMSSDIFSRPIDFSRFAAVYAGAQKNLGPAGVTVVIIRKDLVGSAPESTPVMLNYKTYVAKNSLYNTPPVFSIYMVKLVMDWAEARGGLSAIEKENRNKADLLYNAIDASGGYFRGTAEKSSRSLMNVTFRLPGEDLEAAFLKTAAAAGLLGLKGHRSVGGIRASIYNAVPMKAVEALVDCMEKFRKSN